VQLELPNRIEVVILIAQRINKHTSYSWNPVTTDSKEESVDSVMNTNSY
jgi:hypothetical protein